MRTIPFFLLAMWVATTASGQSVYESRDQAGPVFSDLPSQGARAVTLPQLNIMSSPPVPPAEPAPVAAPVPYTALSIIQPEDAGTIHSNSGDIAVQVAIEPALRVRHGDAIAVRLDHTVLPTVRSSLQFAISPTEWQNAAVDTVEHQLEVAVVDRSGQSLITSAPVRFYVHRATRQ